MVEARTALSAGLCIAAIVANARVLAEPSELPPQVGYNGAELETPRSAGLGGAARAQSSSIEGLFLNPANMSAAKIYHVDASAQVWPQARRQTYGIAAVDSFVNKKGIGGGLAANWSGQDPDGVDRRWFDVRFAMSAPLSDRFLIGASGRYLELKEDGYPRPDGLPPSFASGGQNDKEIVRAVSVDAGITLKLTEELALSAVGTNLTDPGHSFMPLTVGGGIGYGTGEFTLEADTVVDFSTYEDTTMRVMAGGEVLLADVIPVRAGYRYEDATSTHSVSASIGYAAPQFALNAALRSSVNEPLSMALVFGFRYHIEAGGLAGESL